MITNEDQAGLASEQVIWPGSQEVSGPLRVTAGCDSTSVYLRARTQGGQLWDHGVGVGMRGSVPATGVGLQPSGLVCPDASNEGDWDQGAATGQTEYLSPAAGWTHLVHMHIRIFTPSELHPA